MRKLFFTVTVSFFGHLLFAQNQYAESTPPDNMASGVYYQVGPGTNNGALNWTHPFGVKLSVIGTPFRNFELTSTTYPYGDFRLRQWDPNGNTWSSWRDILVKNDQGRYSVKSSFRIEDVGAAREDSYLRISRGSEGKDRAVVSYGDDGNFTWHTGLLYGGGWPTPDFYISTKDVFRNGGVIVHEPEFSITVNGDVGIGTRTPDSKLAVNGDIHAQEVKVDLVGWPDYVFTKDYPLPTLEEVEQHIYKKGHLINMPSAEEVEENGVQLGEMNKLLLEKIEELTLYTLEQEKAIRQLQELQKQHEQLLTKVHTLEAMLQELRNPKTTTNHE